MLSERLLNYEPATISKDLVMQFGNPQDGVIEFAGIVDKGIIEVGYFYGAIKPKNIIAISSQIGCPLECRFCELGSERFTRNLSPEEMYEQVVLMLQQAGQYGMDIDNVKHKVSVSKTGEPLMNRHLLRGLEQIAALSFSFKISTIFPRGAMGNFHGIADFASDYDEPVQIQVSLVSTSERYRAEATGKKVASFKDIQDAAEYWQDKNPDGRKTNLSLILTEGVPCDVNDVCEIFPPGLFRFRFRNYVPTENGKESGLVTVSGPRFEQIKESFQEKGYEVGEWATPTPTEQRFGLAANITRRRYLKMIDGEF